MLSVRLDSGQLVAGFILARFNVLALLVATAICVVGSFVYVVVSDPTLALPTALFPAFALQVGYLGGQFLWRRRGKKDGSNELQCLAGILVALF